MSDLKKYVEERKKRDSEFASGYDEGYEQFKIGMMVREARESAGLSQEELARRLRTKKTAISRIENHAEDIKLSTLGRVAASLGKKLEISIVPAKGRKTAGSAARSATAGGRAGIRIGKGKSRQVPRKKAGRNG